MAATSDITAPGALVIRPRPPFPIKAAQSVLRFVRRKPLGGIGLIIVTVLFLAAIFAPLIAPYGYEEQKISNRFADPGGDHYLGTDDRGRDMFSRIVYGARVSIFVGFGVILTSTTIATLLGTVSGFYGKAADMLIQRLVD